MVVLMIFFFFGGRRGVCWCFEPSQPHRITSGLIVMMITKMTTIIMNIRAFLQMEACAYCGKRGDTQTIRRCTGCKAIRYCSRDCQKGHWSHHKAACKKTRRSECDVNYALTRSREAEIACGLERRTRDRKVATSNPGESGGRIFFFAC